jgi:hypothetical protein
MSSSLRSDLLNLPFANSAMLGSVRTDKYISRICAMISLRRLRL